LYNCILKYFLFQYKIKIIYYPFLSEQKFFKNKFTIQEFFVNAIEGFLFQISHYEKYGNFLWGEYAHGFLGYIEMYAEGSITLQKLLSSLSKKELLVVVSTNRQSKCLCGSNEKLRKCHTKVFKGINKLKQHFSNLYNYTTIQLYTCII